MTELTSPTSLYDMFETNSGAEKEGVWVTIGQSRFKIARAGGSNETFMTEASRRLKPFHAALENLPQKTANQIAVEIFVDLLLLGWENVPDRAGNLLEFSKDAAKKLLLELPNLFLVLQAESQRMSNFTAAAIEAAAKN